MLLLFIGKIVKDPETRVTLEVQRHILMVCPQELHNFMMDDFPQSIVDSKVVISESMICKFLKNSCRHITKVTKRQKEMCGCAMYVIFEDMH